MIRQMEHADRMSERAQVMGEQVRKRQAMWKQLNATSVRTAELIDKLDKLDKPSKKRQKLQNDINAVNKMCDAAIKKLQ